MKNNIIKTWKINVLFLGQLGFKWEMMIKINRFFCFKSPFLCQKMTFFTTIYSCYKIVKTHYMTEDILFFLC